MLTSKQKNVDTARARQLWAEYQQQNDLTAQKGNVAAIDPQSGRIWIGASAIEIADRMQADGFDAPIYLVRIGFDHFIRKGRR